MGTILLGFEPCIFVLALDGGSAAIALEPGQRGVDDTSGRIGDALVACEVEPARVECEEGDDLTGLAVARNFLARILYAGGPQINATGQQLLRICEVLLRRIADEAACFQIAMAYVAVIGADA